MHKIRMIGLDLDGTLLTDAKELLPYTRNVLERATAAGIEVVAATGRPYTGLPKAFKEIPGIRYAVTVNGARVVDMKTERMVYEALLPQDKVIEVMNIFYDYDMLSEVYENGQSYLNEEFWDHLSDYFKDPHMENYIRTTRKTVPDVWEVVHKSVNGMEKAQAIFKTPEDQASCRARIEQIPDVKPVSSVAYNIEVSRADVNKGSSLLKLGEILGIKPEEIMACGDADNDKEMIEWCGLGVAMANSIPDVKAVADFVALSNNEEGVAKAIEEFVLKPINA